MPNASQVKAYVTVLAVCSGACSAGVHGHSAARPVSKTAASSPAHLPTAAQPSTEANITRLTTDILARSQFAHHPLDAELAGKFLDGYLDTLDATHSLFLSSDLRELATYRTTLAQRTRTMGDTSAARAIMARYLERLEQQSTYATHLLQTETFDFTTHDRYSLDREHAEPPADMTAAQDLWRQRLRAEYLQEKLTDAAPEKIVDALKRRYAEQLATMKALDAEEVLEIYLNALAHVYDPHSDYLGHEEMESLSIQMNLALFGIGATLENNDGYCEIHGLVPGGPAARSGELKPGDRIIAVTQPGKAAVELKHMPLSRTVELIRGPKGTPVTLTILAEGAPEGSVPKLVPLIRDEIKLEDEQASARILDLPNGKGSLLRLGVLELPSFYADMGDGEESEHRSVTKDVARLLAKLNAENVRGVVLDLRHNGGGSLNEAISLTGLFIRRGPVVQTRDPSGAIRVDADTDATEQFQGPLVVLASRFSASASEILTGALQDYGRAVVVGDSSTFGKGTVQSVLPLAHIMDDAGLTHSYDPGALKVTIEKFYRPGGASTQLRGVASDIVLPSTSDFGDVSESAMKSPLPWDTVPPALHDHADAVEPYLARLRQASSARVASEKAFAYVASDVSRLRKNLADKSVSLNEAERRDEMAQAKARQSERDAAGKKLLAAAPKAYAITLKNVDSPGLPATTSLADTRATTDSEHKTAHALTGHQAERASVDDTILNESIQILADYVRLAPRLDWR